MTDLIFAFLREGTSDNGLVAHIRSLLIQAGATAALGTERLYKGTTAEKIRQVCEEEELVDLIFVHRDADGRDPNPRHQEIDDAAAAHSRTGTVVPVVPVQATEAWLLVDEQAIREVVGKPSGRVPLRLPALSAIENTHDPKAVLKSACLTASETSGARHKKERTRFDQRRATLLERLETGGPVTRLTSWQRFMTDLTSAATAAIASKEAPVAASEDA